MDLPGIGHEKILRKKENGALCAPDQWIGRLGGRYGVDISTSAPGISVEIVA
jgi:hypothetical protein